MANLAIGTKWEAAPNLEVRIRHTEAGHQCSVYDKSTGTSWASAKTLTVDAIFDRCVWRGLTDNVASFLFRKEGTTKATLIAVDLTNKTIHTSYWAEFHDEVLKTHAPVLQAGDEEADAVEPNVGWQELPAARAEAYDLAANNGIEHGNAEVLFRQHPSWKWGVAGVAGAFVGTRLAWEVASLALSTTSLALSTTYNWVLQPVVAFGGWTGTGLAMATAVVLVADRYHPEERILPRIKEQFLDGCRRLDCRRNARQANGHQD